MARKKRTQPEPVEREPVEPDFENPGFREGLGVGFSAGWQSGRSWGEQDSVWRCCPTCRLSPVDVEAGVRNSNWRDEWEKWEQEVGEEITDQPMAAGWEGEKMPPVPEGWSSRWRRMWEQSYKRGLSAYRNFRREKAAELAAYQEMMDNLPENPADAVKEIFHQDHGPCQKHEHGHGHGAGPESREWLEETVEHQGHNHLVVLPASRNLSEKQASKFHRAIHRRWGAEHAQLRDKHRTRTASGGLPGEAQIGAQAPEGGVMATAVLCLEGDETCGQEHGLQLLKQQTDEEAIQHARLEDIQPIAELD